MEVLTLCIIYMHTQMHKNVYPNDLKTLFYKLNSPELLLAKIPVHVKFNVLHAVGVKLFPIAMPTGNIIAFLTEIEKSVRPTPGMFQQSIGITAH